jgi:hypothetical protein
VHTCFFRMDMIEAAFYVVEWIGENATSCIPRAWIIQKKDVRIQRGVHVGVIGLCVCACTRERDSCVTFLLTLLHWNRLN